MSVFSLIVIATVVAIDGFWGGFAFGLRKIKIDFVPLIIVSSWSVICSMIVMVIGSQLRNIISFEMAKYIGAGLLLLLGIFTLREGFKQKNEFSSQNKKLKLTFEDLVKILRNPLLADVDNQNDIKPSESTMLGLAVAMDASIAAFTVSLFGFNPFITPFLFGLTHFVLIGLGNLISRHNIINHLGEKFSLLPGFILVTLAIIRLI